MTKSKSITVAAFFLAILAGIPLGWVFNPFDEKANAGQMEFGGIHDELGLSEEQKKTMKEIWAKTAADMKSFDRMAIAREKDERVLSMLTDDQKSEYDEIMVWFRGERNKMDEARKARHEESIKQTLALLNEDQQIKFRELIENQKKNGRIPFMNGGRGNGGRR